MSPDQARRVMNAAGRLHDNPAGIAAIPVVRSSIPPPVPAPPSGIRPACLADPGHWHHPVIYMSRVTTRALWRLLHGTAPDLHGDLRFGQARIPVLFDDRLPFGEMRLEEDPDPA